MRTVFHLLLFTACVVGGVLLAVAIATWPAPLLPRAKRTAPIALPRSVIVGHRSPQDTARSSTDRANNGPAPAHEVVCNIEPPGATSTEPQPPRSTDEHVSEDRPAAGSDDLPAADNRPAVWFKTPALESSSSVATVATRPGSTLHDKRVFQQVAPTRAVEAAAVSGKPHTTVEMSPYPLIAQQPSASSASGNGIPSLEGLMQMIRAAQDSGAQAVPSAVPATSGSKPANSAPPASAGQLPSPPAREPRSSIKPATGKDANEGALTINIQDENIRTVLEAFSAQGDLNILASPNVQGTVSAVLSNVDLEEALDAILKSTGYIARREGDFIYVGTPQDFQKIDHQLNEIGTRMYRPNYVNAAELQSLLQPLLTPGVGKISVTSQSEVGIASNDSKAGGDAYAAAETVLVQDYRAVLEQFDQIVREVDQRPLQVAIEAMILSVRLNDDYRFGIDWDLLRNRNTIQFTVGSPDATTVTGGGTSGDTGGDSQSTTGGLTFAFLDSSLGSFLEALETVGDANVIATPRLLCLNKQRAEILIGAELGYVSTTVTETSTSQTVEFLEVGAQLRLRPFISSDGNIRMEVHPELSTGQVRIEGGFTLPDKDVTSVTTNIMIRDGSTLIIGGLVREDVQTNTSQVPLLGNLPGVGVLFRSKQEEIERREILLLVTPRIVYEPEVADEGEQAACEFHRRHAVYTDHMSPIGKRFMGRRYFQLAQQAWFAGDRDAALRYIHWAVHFDPMNRAAIDLQAEIESGGPPGDHSLSGIPAEGVPVDGPFEVLDGEEVAPWLLDALKSEGSQAVPLHPRDPGIPGPQRDIRPKPNTE